MPKKILVADDDKAILNIYSRLFAGTDYRLSEALTFTEAARMLREGEYDLLITDFTFPDGVGTELIRLFNESGKRKKSVMVTGTSCANEKPDCGCDYIYLEKPFKAAELFAAVQKALS